MKLAEAIAVENKLRWFIVCKTLEESKVVNGVYRTIDFTSSINVRVIPFRHFVNSGKINSFINNLIAFFIIIRYSKSKKDKLFYSDRSNVMIAALLRVLLRSPVVLRVLGVYPDQKELADSFWAKLLSPVVYLSYKTPFTLVISTQDGSGVEFYLRRLLNKQTEIVLLLNGVDRHKGKDSDGEPAEKIKFLFVGKIIYEKGILDLLEAFAMVKGSDRFLLDLVGKGNLMERVKGMVDSYGLENSVNLVGSVPHGKVKDFFNKADVYISLNKLGNLSNTVLEAMAAGKCIIMLDREEKTHTDESTEKLVPKDAALRVSRDNIKESLAGIIEYLLQNPQVIKVYAKRMKELSSEFLWSWDQRINYEIELINKLS